MSAEVIIVGWLAVCFVGLFAYSIGRRMGHKEGRSAALCEAPLRLRMDALEKGNCPICNSVSTHATWYNEREEVIR
jgi:hypothetical protein